ncbi:MAG: hypothetical protein ABW216_21485, partial [Candidatus Rokuibacteriota bacterium]
MIPRRALAAAVLVAAALAGHVAGASNSALPGPALDLDSARLAQIDAARRYRESLESLRPLREAAVERSATEAERRRALALKALDQRLHAATANAASRPHSQPPSQPTGPTVQVQPQPGTQTAMT